MTFHHQPVLLDEVVEVLAPRGGGKYVDCTLGGGGHAAALLAAADCQVLGLDRDPAALAAATERCGFAGDRLSVQHRLFAELPEALASHGWLTADGVLADLGVSSHQLDTAERGFSFRAAGPVDMRMDPGADLSAADIVNDWPEDDIADVVYKYGEERKARRVASAIVAGRPWTDTVTLANAVATVVGRGKGRIHPATRTFQALRIATNQELAQIESLVEAGIRCLVPGGRLAVISFHSLEDRIVKQGFAAAAGKNRPRDAYGNPVGEVLVTALRPIIPRDGDPNPRARSARLRVVERVA